MSIRFILETVSDAAVRVGAGASGTGLLISLAIATARNAARSLSDEYIPHQPQRNPNAQAQHENSQTQQEPPPPIRPSGLMPNLQSE